MRAMATSHKCMLSARAIDCVKVGRRGAKLGTAITKATTVVTTSGGGEGGGCGDGGGGSMPPELPYGLGLLPVPPP